MRSSTVVALLATSAVAQSSSSSKPETGSSAHIINPLGLQVSTVTMLGSSSGTTTYVNSCSDAGVPTSWLSEATAEASSAGSSAASVASSTRSVAETLLMTPIAAPSTTAAARLRRRDANLLDGLCEPLTIKQASEYAQIQLKDPSEGAWTAEVNCNWKGALGSADLTCTAVQSGVFASVVGAQGTTSAVLKASEIAEASVIQTVEVVSPASNSANPTASGSQSGSTKSTTSAPASSGAAAGGPHPISAMAFVGGAAGIFAAALAL
ncbi:uncharacterized protein M421DRAFT_419618 [Didymella exigua CBS 183.55]|uniref:Uncharacterized protein n=1 Tax=Didymella exigua CBS 183.55 TaxID=1150837 RepID=A0A6A5RN72_9PLEO|nr:uncharacterized protein M421DRAFT_419618 [Didymella exigua CBS 183.55]KAF1929851.1 hypothetical protein M421DRAFT_419618 [Didymella exigua CBS 183.55]